MAFSFSVPIRAGRPRKPSFHDDWGCDSEWMSVWDRAQVHAPNFMPRPGAAMSSLASVLRDVWTQDRIEAQIYGESQLLKAFPTPEPKPRRFRRLRRFLGA